MEQRRPLAKVQRGKVAQGGAIGDAVAVNLDIGNQGDLVREDLQTSPQLLAGKGPWQK
ncbi:MAG: hypothetical protein J0I12_17860 [Candidatus Eremiobacteraeota bacterium]|nr:hypothetical protein [Candidatus Eremiobacteraeota bacterium]